MGRNLHHLQRCHDRTQVGEAGNGGKLVENIVHDEIVIDEPEDSGFTIADACQLMTTPPDWAAGLPLDADGYECDYYRKD